MMFKLKKLIGIVKEPLFIRALLNGAAAGVEHRKILANLSVCRHVVDIGANRGQFALISRHCFPNAKIDSFEPLKEPSEIYKRVFANDDLSCLHRFAVGPEKAESIIHVSSRDDSSSLLPISEGQISLFPETFEKETRVIRVVPLDEVLSGSDILSPALLKIDVQGFELSALHGCSSLLHNFQYIYVECSFVELYLGQAFADEIIRFLINYNFRLVGVYNMHYDKFGKAIQADFLFESSDENTYSRN